MKSIYSLPAIAVAAQLGLTGCSSESQAQESTASQAALTVKAATVERKNVDALYFATGTVKGRNTAVMTSKVVGYVREVKVDAGQLVQEGQTLAVLEADVIAGTARRASAGLNAAHQGVNEAENGVIAAESAATVATATFQRMKALVASGSISEQQFDEAKAQVQAALAARDMAKARLGGASAHVAEAQAAVAEANAMLGYATVKAPFKGRVIERHVDPGNLASPGMPLLSVEQEGALRVEASVEESKAGLIAIGDKVTVEVPALDTSLAGVVSHIVPAVDVASRALIVKVELQDPNACQQMRPGMFARAQFRVGSDERLVIPRSAVVSRGQLDRVFTVDDGRARLRIVTLGEARDQWVEVLSGLNAGEQVVQEPGQSVRDGTPAVL